MKSAAVLGTALLAGTAALAAQSAPVFRTTATGVRVDVAVTERGRPVDDLDLTEFTIHDNGVLQRPLSLSFGKLPIDVTVALDVSGSVQGTVLRDLRRAVDQLRTRLRPDDRLKLLTFNERIRRMVNFTDEGLDTTDVFSRIVPDGLTALFDTIAVALASSAPPDRRQLVIVFSDGDDTASAITSDTLLQVARHSPATVASVLWEPQGGVMRASRDTQRFFASLAAETGGVVVSSAVAVNDANTFARILDDFRSVYVLHYTPTDVPEPGFHPLTVRVTRNNRYDVRARTGYVRE